MLPSQLHVSFFSNGTHECIEHVWDLPVALLGAGSPRLQAIRPSGRRLPTLATAQRLHAGRLKGSPGLQHGKQPLPCSYYGSRADFLYQCTVWGAAAPEFNHRAAVG